MSIDRRTDITGSEDQKFDRSHRRAGNVGNALVRECGIDPLRGDARGTGTSQPGAANDRGKIVLSIGASS